MYKEIGTSVSRWECGTSYFLPGQQESFALGRLPCGNNSRLGSKAKLGHWESRRVIPIGEEEANKMEYIYTKSEASAQGVLKAYFMPGNV